MIGDLCEAGMPSSVDLVAGAPYETDLLYHEEFVALQERFPVTFRYRTAISRYTHADQPSKMYVQDQISQNADELLAKLQSPRTLIYICGIAGMEIGVFQMLAEMLDPESLSQYLTIKAGTDPDPALWERSMIPRKLKPTKRMFLEVY
ncbi:MAG: hypothetical protein JJ974_11720, partial [Phycisphaerales bacterium]|nr:hypothetical protein [Phycisphaerales bacterium]